MSKLIFESSFVSLANEEYKVKLYGKTYEGLEATILSGSGNVFNLAGDWTDYLQNFQDVVFGTYQTPLTTAYKNRVIADGGTFENEECVIEFLGENIRVQSFDYDSGADVTLTTLNATYDGQTVINNYVEGANSYVPFFKPVIVDLVSQYDNSEDYLLSPLMTSSSNITYANVQEDRTSVDTAFFDRFVELYLQSDDDELRLTIERNTQIDETLLNAYKNRVLADSGTFENETCLEEFLLDITEKVYQLEWAGNLVIDLIEWDNESSPRAYTFKAIDGIDRLKDVPYNGDVTDLKNKKLIDIVVDVLALNGLDEFWANDDTYIRETVEFESADVLGVSAANSPLDYSYLAENILIEMDGKIGDDYTFKSGYEILNGLMELFSARLIHTNGHYYIQQIRNYKTTAITTRDFLMGDIRSLSGVYTARTYTHSNNTLRPLSGGKFGYLYGIKRAMMQKEENDLLSIPKRTLFDTTYLFFDPTSLGELVFDEPINTNVGNISGGLAAGQSILAVFPFTMAWGIVADMDFELRFIVFDATNTRYLCGSDTEPIHWSNDVVRTDRYYSTAMRSTGQNLQPRNPAEVISIQTPIIPYELENVLIKVEVHITTRRRTPASVEQVFALNGYKIYLPTLDGDETESIYVDNPNTRFTKDLDLGNLIINESNSNVQINNLSVNENYNGGTFEFKVGGLWNADFGDDYGLTQNRVLEAMALQQKALRKYMGDFEGTYYPFQTIPYDGTVFACQSLQKNYLTDESSGQWFEVLHSTAGLEPNIIGHTEIKPTDYGGDTMTVLNQGVGLGRINGDITPFVGITSILINTVGNIRKGDKLQLISDSGFVFKEITSTMDVAAAGDEITLTVEPFDLATPLLSGTRIIYGYKKMYFSEKLRFDSLQHTDVKVAPTALADLENGEVIFVGRDIFVREGNEIFRHRANPYI